MPWKIVAGALALSVLACSGAIELPAERSSRPLVAAQLHGDALPARTVVLTYDDGPDEHTLTLARYLAGQGIPATFFVNGRRFCASLDAQGGCLAPQPSRPCADGRSQAAVSAPRHYPESLLDELVALGHGLANHSQDHCHLLAETDPANLLWQLQATQQILERHRGDGQGARLFRAPYGEWAPEVLDRLAAVMGLPALVGPVSWEVDGRDYSCWRSGLSPEACAEGYLAILEQRPLRNGILLLHDRPEYNVGYEGPLLLTRILVERLQSTGFAFVPLAQALDLQNHSDADANSHDADPSGADLPQARGGGGCEVLPGGDGGQGAPAGVSILLLLALGAGRVGRRRMAGRGRC